MDNALKTPVAVVNAAYVTYCGGNPIESFSDSSPAALSMTASYETIVRACIAAAPWRFAMRKAQLQLIEQEAHEDHDGVYATPDGAITVWSVSRAPLIKGGDGTPVDFTPFEDRLHIDAYPDDVLLCDYTIRAAEMRWTPMFSHYVVLSVASALASGVLRDPALSQSLSNTAFTQQRLAAGLEAQARTPRRLPVNNILHRRRV